MTNSVRRCKFLRLNLLGSFGPAILALAIASRLILLILHFSHFSFSPQFETFEDFNVYYVKWWQLLRAGLVPYRDFFYQYPPLFLYALYPLYYFGGAFCAGLGIVLADAGSAVLIYLIAKQVATGKVAIVAGIGYALSPFALLYEGYVLFSLEPMLFFVLLAIFLLRRNNLVLSAACLAVATLFKQEALFLLPAYLIYAQKFSLKRIGIAAFCCAAILLVVSMPFLLTSPVQYLGSIAYRTIVYPSNTSAATNGVTCFMSQNLSKLLETCIGNSKTTVLTASIPRSDQISSMENDLFEVVLIPIVLLVLPALYVFRDRPTFLELSGAYSFAALVTVVAYLAIYVPLEEVARYAYLPAYALLLVSGTRWQSSLTAVGFAGLSLILPPGVVQLTLPFLAILGVMAVDDIRREKVHTFAQRSDANISSYEFATASIENLPGKLRSATEPPG